MIKQFKREQFITILLPLYWLLEVIFTFTDWPVSLQEVRLEINLKQIACDAFHCVIDWQNMNALSILHIWTWLNTENQKGEQLNDPFYTSINRNIFE